MDTERLGLSALEWNKVTSTEWTATDDEVRFRASHRSGAYFDVYATTKILDKEAEIYVGRWEAQVLKIVQ